VGGHHARGGGGCQRAWGCVGGHHAPGGGGVNVPGGRARLPDTAQGSHIGVVVTSSQECM
jgi:hypothetical protein